MRDAGERGVVVERGGEHAADTGEELLIRLCAATIADVAQHDSEEAGVGEVESRDRRFGRKLAPVLSQAEDRATLAHATGDVGTAGELGQVPTVDPTESIGEEPLERRADDLRGIVAKDLLRPVIEVQDLLILVDGDDRVDGNRQDALELRP